MIQRRAADLGMRVKIGCHTFRATGITAYLEAGGTLENAQAMAAHESPRTTKLCTGASPPAARLRNDTGRYHTQDLHNDLHRPLINLLAATGMDRVR